MQQRALSQNGLLASLPAADFDLLRPHLASMKLDHEAVLYEAGENVERAYFPHIGIVSLVLDLPRVRRSRPA